MDNSVELEKLIEGYKHAVAVNNNDATAHLHLAMYFFKKNMLTQAIEHFNATIQINPKLLVAHYYCGIVYFKQHAFDLAKLRFLSVLDLDKEHLNSQFYLGIIFLHEENLQQAECHFQSVLALNAQHVDSLVNLGTIALKRHLAQEAIAYFTQALMFDNHHVDALRNLALTFLHYDRFENALTYYYELQKVHPLDLDDYYNMGVAHMSLERFSDAVACFEQVLAQAPKHHASLSNLAAILIRQHKREQAIPLLQLAIQSNPRDESSQFMLNVLLKNQAQPTASQAYVKNLFDNYAVNFDQHLKKTLEYSLPQQSYNIVKKFIHHQLTSVVDLGCGTGLSGLLLREHCEKLIGVDLSIKMLEQARIKNCYDELIEKDIISFLQDSDQQFDLIQMLEVLPYFDALQDLFSALVPRLALNGLLVVSAEISDDQPWKVQNNMRFCHHPEYIIDLANKFNLPMVHSDSLISRKENEQYLTEILLVFKNKLSIA